MNIYVDAILGGEARNYPVRALVDTGAEISLLPSDLAAHVGAWITDRQRTVVGIHGQARTLPIVVTHLCFPSLNKIGGEFVFVMSDAESDLIVGMDILNPLGITINTKTGQLSVKNEMWEAFKTLTTAGVLIFGGVKLVEKLSEKKEKRL